MSLQPIYKTKVYADQTHSVYLTLQKSEMSGHSDINGFMFRISEQSKQNLLGEGNILINGVRASEISDKENVLKSIDMSARVSIACTESPPAIHLQYE